MSLDTLDAVSDLPTLCKDMILDVLKKKALGELFYCRLVDRNLEVHAGIMDSTNLEPEANEHEAIEELSRLCDGVCGIPMMDRTIIYCTLYDYTYESWRNGKAEKVHIYENVFGSNSDEVAIKLGITKIVMVYHSSYFD